MCNAWKNNYQNGEQVSWLNVANESKSKCEWAEAECKTLKDKIEKSKTNSFWFTIHSASYEANGCPP